MRTYKIGKIQVIWRHSSLLLKTLVILLIVFSMAAMVALAWVQQSIQEQTRQVLSEAAALEGKNQVLEERIQSIDAVDTIQHIAQEELGLVNPDTILIRPE